MLHPQCCETILKTSLVCQNQEHWCQIQEDCHRNVGVFSNVEQHASAPPSSRKDVGTHVYLAKYAGGMIIVIQVPHEKDGQRGQGNCITLVSTSGDGSLTITSGRA
jgi:hypothetical protein